MSITFWDMMKCLISDGNEEPGVFELHAGVSKEESGDLWLKMTDEGLVLHV